MRILIVPALAGLLLVGAAGCNDHMDAGDRMRTHLEDAREEVARHHQAVVSAQSLDAVRTDVARHETTMDDIMGGMQGAMEDMSHCSGSGMDGMMAGMDGMQAAMMDHAGEMDAATTMEAAGALCDEHAATMTTMMDSVDAHMGNADCM
jgi:hypothetical protein